MNVCGCDRPDISYRYMRRSQFNRTYHISPDENILSIARITFIFCFVYYQEYIFAIYNAYFILEDVILENNII